MRRVQDLSGWDDGFGEMHQIRLDPETARRLVDGSVAPDDAPPGYAGVAELLATARNAASAPVPAREEPTVAAMQAIVLEHLDSPTVDSRRKNVRTKVLAAKTTAAATVVLLGAGTAAAATGSLPGAAQGTASDMLSKVGISVPGNNNDHANARGQSGDHPSSGDSGTSDSATGGTSNSANTQTGISSNRQGNGPNPNAFPGLCRAQIASGGHPNPNSVVPGIVCTGVTPAGGGSNTTSGTDHPTGPPSSTPASGTAPVTTPDDGAASNGSSGSNASSAGQGTASGHDGGASSTGTGAASHGAGNAGSRP